MTSTDNDFPATSLDSQRQKEIIESVSQKLGKQSLPIGHDSSQNEQLGELQFKLVPKPKTRMDEPPRVNFFRLSVLGRAN